MPESFDILVIGGGISGISLAARLAGRASVALVEAEEHFGVHATGRSAALLVETYGPPVIRELTSASRAFFEQPPAGFAEARLASSRGALVYAGDGDGDRLRNEFEQARLTTDVVWLDAPDVLKKCPLLRPGVATAGFLEPRTLDLDTNALLQGFIRAARGAGAKLYINASADRIERLNGRWLVAAGEQKISARILVNAAGAWADSVAKHAGVRPRNLEPRRRTAATVEVPPELAAILPTLPAVVPVDESYYFKPEARTIMVSLSEETPSEPCNAWPDDLDVATALDRFHQATIVPPVRPTATWAGLRTFAPDRIPVVGFDKDEAGFFWYAGQGGYGIQTSPALSEFAAGLIFGERPDARLTEALGPARLDDFLH